MKKNAPDSLPEILNYHPAPVIAYRSILLIGQVSSPIFQGHSAQTMEVFGFSFNICGLCP